MGKDSTARGTEKTYSNLLNEPYVPPTPEQVEHVKGLIHDRFKKRSMAAKTLIEALGLDLPSSTK